MKLFSWLKSFLPIIKRATSDLPYEGQGTGASAGIDPDENIYRRLTTSPRDYSPLVFEKALKLSISLYSKNPFFARLIKVPIQAIMSSGITITAEDPKVQELIDIFWGDDKHGLKKIFREFLIEFLLTGELHLPVAVNKTNGLLSLTIIDTLNVEGIITDPNDVTRRTHLKYKASKKNVLGYHSAVTAEIINKGGMAFYEEPRGQVLSFFHDRQGACAHRGTPSGGSLLDWVDLFDQNMFNDAERMASMRAFVWDIMLSGYSEEECEDYLRKNFPEGIGPKPNSVFAHNDKITLNAVSPDLKFGDTRLFFDMMQTLIIGSAGYPRWFFAYSGDTNVATAREENTPAVWTIEDIQTMVQDMLQTIVSYQIEAAKRIGFYSKQGPIDNSTNGKFKVQMGAVLQRDMSKFLVNLSSTIDTVRKGLEAHLLTKELGYDLICYVLNQYDFKVSSKELQQDLNIEELLYGKPALNGQANGVSKNSATEVLNKIAAKEVNL